MVKTLSDPQQVWYSIECLYIELILLQTSSTRGEGGEEDEGEAEAEANRITNI